MTTETTQKMLERVRALLAKAEGTNFPEEAEAFRAKADELMTRFAIDSFMLDEAMRDHERRATPTRRDVSRARGKFAWELRSIFSDLARHCRCVEGSRGVDYSAGTVPVYGLPSDLDYLDLLFTTIQLEVAKNLQPAVDPEGEVGEQVFKQRQAGIGWKEIARKVYKAGLITLTPGEFKKITRSWPQLADLDPSEVEWTYVSPYWRDLRNRLANYNRRYVREHGLSMERNYVKPEVYQRSFIAGFQDEIRRRLWSMERSTSESFAASGQSESFALAVRDVRQQAIDLYESEFPPPPPLTDEEREAIRKPRGTKVARSSYREVTYSDSAMSAGRAKAREVNLTNKPGRGLGNQKELDR
jgi:hypothetical protein